MFVLSKSGPWASVISTIVSLRFVSASSNVRARHSTVNVQFSDLQTHPISCGFVLRVPRSKMIGKSNIRLIGIIVTLLCMGTVLTDWLNILRARHLELDLQPNRKVAQKQSDIAQSTIGKLSMLYGEPNPLYERALAAHLPHNQKFGYKMYVLREKTLPGYWSKPAYILNQLLIELALPEEERLEWLVWFDGDIVLMNPKIPLEIFLPPKENWSHIHAIVTNDHRGLNNGVFFLRVHEWSVWFMTACLGTEIFDPDIDLQFGDQSAMGMWVKEDRFRPNIMHVPQRWFNAYAGYRGDNLGQYSDPLAPPTKFKANSIKEGDLLVHHAGNKALRTQRMSPWMDIAEQHLPQWELDLDDTGYEQEIRDFWEVEAPKEEKRVDTQIEKEDKLEEERLRRKQEKAEAAQKKKAEAQEAEREKQETDDGKKNDQDQEVQVQESS
ncbi:hypothetical protein PV10_07925 [Exophiala mesophila]|uniref:Galactosyl transferase GMA12/MNN10 family protein n=1 Tax=Exophiala mesophila TaxID=212818 RepID=A0A0D1Z751_EXOME|nr:uncharacterized protein PV10_07925 [Exophiala mesophila]KIV90642.1 hypothetical protein PV10_07925 [Exophiala mesophila]